MYQKEINKKRSQAQTNKPCLYAGCVKGARVLGKLGDIELTYCGRHRKYGERVLNFLINSMMRHRLSNLLRESKQQLFIDNEPCLCDECNVKIATFVNTMVSKVSELEQYQERFGETGFDFSKNDDELD